MGSHKKYIIWKHYGAFENWGISDEAVSWESAIIKREEALLSGIGEVLIT